MCDCDWPLETYCLINFDKFGVSRTNQKLFSTSSVQKVICVTDHNEPKIWQNPTTVERVVKFNENIGTRLSPTVDLFENDVQMMCHT